MAISSGCLRQLPQAGCVSLQRSSSMRGWGWDRGWGWRRGKKMVVQSLLTSRESLLMNSESNWFGNEEGVHLRTLN